MEFNKLGISTLTWVDSLPIAKAVELAGDNGFKAVDLGILNGWSEFGAIDLSKDFEKYIGPVEKALNESKTSVMAINASLNPEGEVSPEDQLRALCKAAKRLKASVGIILPIGHVLEDHEVMVERVKKELEICADEGVVLTYETHHDHHTETIENALAIAKEIPGVLYTLDGSHYIIKGYSTKEIMTLLPYTVHAHIRPCGIDGWDTIQVEADLTTDRMYEWIKAMDESDYDKGYAFEVIENFNIDDTLSATKIMLEKIQDMGLVK